MDGGLGLQSLAGFICSRWRFLSVMIGGFDWNPHKVDLDTPIVLAMSPTDNDLSAIMALAWAR